MAEFDFDWAMKKLKATLKPERYEHSVGVMETAAVLAARFGADIQKTKIAGILHDCAKNIAPEESYRLCETYGLTLDAVTQRSYKMVHQYLGAELAREEYGVTDEEILNAIRCHTTGKADMTLLDKILYLADFTEPNRDKEPFAGLGELRDLCKTDIDDAMRFALEISIKSIADRGLLMHLDTVHAWNWFLAKKLTQNT